MAALLNSHGSDFVYDFFCELCIEENHHVEADGYCVDCEEYLCESCYKAHRKTRATRHHTLQGKDTMPMDTPLSLNRVSRDIATKCKLHSSKSVEYYCRSHNVLGCSTCFMEGHRGCFSIEAIADLSVNIFENQEFKDFLYQLQYMQKKSRDIIARAHENSTVSQRCCADVVSSMRRLKEAAISKLNEDEQNIVALAEQIKTEDEEKMASIEDDCEAMSGKIEQMSSDVATLQTSNKVCQLYIKMRESQGDVKFLQENLGKIDGENNVRIFRFEASTDLSSVLRCPCVLGNISQKRNQALNLTRPNANDAPRADTGSQAPGKIAKTQEKSVKSSSRPVYQDASASGSATKASVVDPLPKWRI